MDFQLMILECFSVPEDEGDVDAVYSSYDIQKLVLDLYTECSATLSDIADIMKDNGYRLKALDGKIGFQVKFR